MSDLASLRERLERDADAGEAPLSLADPKPLAPVPLRAGSATVTVHLRNPHAERDGRLVRREGRRRERPAGRRRGQAGGHRVPQAVSVPRTRSADRSRA